MNQQRLYTLDVFLISGPVTKAFLRKNKVMSRRIQIRGEQTLSELHEAIFDAFDREEEHMYEFQVGGKSPMDPDARRYGLAMEIGLSDEDNELAGAVVDTSIDSLQLKQQDAFGYWFDFGDDWWHQINVVSIEDKAGPGRFPKVIKRTGKSPPQYVDWDKAGE